MTRSLAVIPTGLLLVLLSCASSGSSFSSQPDGAAELDTDRPAHLLFLGDVMLGRAVAEVAEAEPESVFEQLRPVLAAADLVLVNLESPLTSRPHLTAGYALEADPAVALLLASAGIDIVDLANNHAMDAGPYTVSDTMAAVESVGLRTVGAGADAASAAQPLIETIGDLTIGIVAFDLSGGLPAGASTAGVNAWRPDPARQVVTELRSRVDLVVVGVHGGVEYLPQPDPVLRRVTRQLAEWGADVVWAHGAHVDYPVQVVRGDRSAVIAPGLGNALFDQRMPGTDSGQVLELLVDADGALAMRTGRVLMEAGRTSFGGWDEPDGDAVALQGEWWTPLRSFDNRTAGNCSTLDVDAIVRRLPTGSVIIDSDCGEVSVVDSDELVVAYRRPTTPELLQNAFPGHRWADSDGRGAHLAVMSSDGRMVWGAATLLQPIQTVTACSGALAVGYTTLDDSTVIAAGAWTWSGFGFRTSTALAGPASIGCADIDHDGLTEPVVSRDELKGDTP